ncbi:hypothetical protein PMAC_002131 [Pneumocystis sp. 'macacae']|nr:hypothetical protein PMAC_002131 [Pneumocystis sp. 'macacae']
MKIFVLVKILGVAHAFSENIEFLHKRSTSLNPLKNLQLISLSKEKIFALILKKNTLNGQCQAKLQEYCEKLENIGHVKTIIQSFHPGIKNFCDKTRYKDTCNDFQKSLPTYCEGIKKSIEGSTKKFPIPHYECQIQTDCIFIEEACSEKLKEQCNNLRSLCKETKRDNLRTDFLLRAFSGNLKTQEDCEKVINKKCLIFMGESDELMEFCLSSNRCQDLMSLIRTKCINLKLYIGGPRNTKMSKEVCNLFFKDCYFHKSNCNNTFEDDCKKLEEECRGEGEYTPFSLTFNPLEKEITLIEEIQYKELFESEIGKPGIKDMIDLLSLLVKNDVDTCETSVNDCYEFCSSLPELKDLYDGTKKKMNESKKEICTGLRNNLEYRCRALKSKLHGLSMSNTSDDQESTVLGWSEQSTELDERLCIDLESECFYLRKPCISIDIKMNNACINLKSACLKTRLFRKNYQLFQSALRGKLHNLTKTNFLEICVNELLELCKKEINIDSPILISFCLRPWDTCHALESDIQRQGRELRINLGWKRDFPSDEDCKKLEERCKILKQDSRINDLPCLTLKERCNHLKNAKELEEILLKKQAEKLNNLNICIRKVTEICNNMSKRKRMGFALSCIQLNTTCQMITRDIKFKCTALGKNMDFMKVLEKTKGENASNGPECDFWEPYCDKYMSNCEKLIKDNGEDGKCKKLKENCKSHRELQNKENEVMYKLQGSLSGNKCKSALDKHCLDWTKTDNNVLKNFCNDSTGAKNDTPRIELCEKLEKRIKERCTELSTKLNTMATEIEKSVEAVKELSGIAEKALETAKFTLNKQKTDINNAALVLLYNANTNMKTGLREDTVQKNQSEYLQQKDANLNITNKEAMAFDAATEALKVYTEVKAECKNLLLECGFKEDCSEYKDSCEKIEEVCNQLKPLKIKSSGKEIINQTIIETTIITEIRSDGTQKTVTVGQCTSVRTTDMWVTSTSTYTRTSTQTSTITSTMTLTSTRKCKPTKCATKDGEEAGDVKPSEGIRVSGWSVMKGVILVMIISVVV